ncbi:MAG TPA: hypothetical protein VMV86_04985 [Methanosarcinales archaeon]|nr:hypothetical protein [Methanosarcinales archaeon]
MASSIKYANGDVTNPKSDGRKLIIHCCNDIGVMGAGVALALANKWPKVKTEYRQWHRSNKGFKLGNVQYVKVKPDIVVVNMIGQKDIRSKGGVAPIRYGAIGKCLEKVGRAAILNKATVHAPKFGSGLAGGSWTKIEEIIIAKLCSIDVDVTVYNYE